MTTYTTERRNMGHGVVLVIHTPVRTVEEQAEFEARLADVQNDLLDMIERHLGLAQAEAVK